jgi:UDP-N-acetylmuramyl pentapeptide phosphotransferase/UDP-N-acetylglucosamine-1-phosphate transferase
MILLGLSIVATIFGFFIMRELVGLWNLKRLNFQGREIPSGFGFFVVLSAVPSYIALLFIFGVNTRTTLFFSALVAFGVIGLLDDIFGSRDVGGFCGHFGLLRKGKVSTGLVKAIGGGLFGFAVGTLVANFRLADSIVNGLLISLCANLLNLLDLRPGRAVFFYWFGVLALLVITRERFEIAKNLLPTFIPTAVLTVLDRHAKVMIGDSGSNALGALLGLALAYEASFFCKLILVLFMAGVHVYSEKFSISALIESNRMLRAIDRMLGAR